MIARRNTIPCMGLALFAVACTASPAAATAVRAGFRDFSYGSTVTAPTGQKPESKLWFNDGRWWAVMFNVSSGRFEVYGFNEGTQATDAWTSTGTVVDARRTAQADVRWTGSKLYVVSHVGEGATTADQGVIVNRYGYTPGSVPGTGTYTPELSKQIASKALEAVVLDRDSAGRLWATWTDGNDSGGRAVYITHTVSSDLDFVAPYVLPVADAGHLSTDDISALVVSGGKVGVIWSNQTSARLSFATHDDGNADDQAWTTGTLCATAKCPDDHINIRSVEGAPGGQAYAIVKTSLNDVASPGTAPLVVLYHIDMNTLTFDSHTVWTVADDMTRPIVQVDGQNGELYAFAAAPCCAGGAVYMKKSTVANPAFAAGPGTPFIQSGIDTTINNPTSTKQSLDRTTGLLVLASDDQTRYYLHSYLPLPGGGTMPRPPPARATSLSIAGRPPTTVYRGATVISGRLRGEGSGARVVALRADEYPFTGDAVVASVRTDADGSYSFRRRPSRNTRFRTTAGALRSPLLRLGVRIRTSLFVSDLAPRAGERLRFSGRACPAHDGRVVRIQRRTRSGRYVTVARTRLLAARRCSVYLHRFRISHDGRYRVTVDDADHARGISRSRLIDVHR
ncbi:MAG: hypothetical protein M3301_02630 [Chloroflexota bacterium]|nr:hypothetical protein [Chloroflexota bacterium]